MTNELELELVVVETEEKIDKLDELYQKIVESNLEYDICQYIDLSKRQTKILQKIKIRKSQ